MNDVQGDGGPGGRSFETGFDEVQRSAASLLNATKQLQSCARALHKAAGVGDIAKIHQLTDKLRTIVGAVDAEAAGAARSWGFTAAEEEAYLVFGYDAELRAAASVTGLRLVPLQDRLAAFPSFVRIVPTQRALRVDQRKITGVRPSKVVEFLKARQTGKPRRTAEQTIELLFDAYAALVGEDIGKGVPLTDIYELLTLLPETRKSYDRTDFAMDILLLDESGVRATKAGSHVSFPASTGTRDARGVLSIPTREGESKSYYAIRFHKGTV